jgi:hypothetical protein
VIIKDMNSNAIVKPDGPHVHCIAVFVINTLHAIVIVWYEDFPSGISFFNP